MGCTVSEHTETKSRLNGGLGPIRNQIPNWDKEADRLHDAVSGLGTDEDCVVRILARFTNKQRKRLLKAYKERFNEDLTAVLESELSGTAKEVVSALLCPPITYDVQSLKKAFDDQDYDTVETVIISSKSDVLMDVEEQYLNEYSKTMEEELLKIPDKDLRHILVSLLNVDRPFTNKRADKMAAKERANQLYNDRDILSLLCEPVGRNQLKETLAAFLQLYRVDINQFIDENCSSLSTHAKDTLKDCVLHIDNPPLYFAKKMKDANETQMLRLMVSRSEIDLYYIKREFLRWYSSQLQDAIHKQCGREYAKLLTEILELRGQYSQSAKKR